MIAFEEYQKIVRRKRVNVTLVLKVTNKCPLNCTYCYHFHNNPEDMSQDMDIELFKEAILKIAPSFEQVNIHIHGGEPLSLPGEKLEELFKFVNDYREAVKDYQEVYPAVQTNLCFYDDEKAKLFEKYQIGLSTSFDGIYNEETRGVDIQNTIDKLNGIEKKGIINVVTKEAIDQFDQQMETFGKLKDATVMSNAVFPYCCPDKSKLEPGDYANYVIKRFEYQLENNIKPSWDTLRYFNSVIHEGKGVDCFCSYCLNSIYTVNPSGRIQGCDVRHEDEYFFGNVKDICNHNDIFELEGYKRFEKITYDLMVRCSECDCYQYCKGGCFNRTMVNKDSSLSKDSYCYDIKMMINYFKDFFNKYDNDPNKLPSLLQGSKGVLLEECKDKKDFYEKEGKR